MPPVNYAKRPRAASLPSRGRTTSRRISFSSGPIGIQYGPQGIGLAAQDLSMEYNATSYPSFGSSLTGGGSSKSSGFISTTLRSRRGKRGDKFNTSGTTLVQEIGGVIQGGVATSTTGNTIAVGHASCPSVCAQTLVWRAILKLLLIKMGQTDLSNFDQSIPGHITGDIIRVNYQLTPDVSPTFFDVTIGAGTTTPNQIGYSLAAHFRSVYDPNIGFHSIVWYGPATGGTKSTTTINLKNCMLVFNSKSTLKVQNNTTETTGGDEESLNNVPLHGKAYFGNGTGTEAWTRDPNPTVGGTTFRADNEFGAIARVPTERWYQEVVPATHFVQVKQFGKVVLDPGHIKTSVLSFYGKFSLSSIYKKLFDKTASGFHSKTSIGNYRFMLLEKMIQASTPTAANQITVAYEVNLRMGCYATTKNNFETAQQNNLMNIAAAV